MLGKKIAMISVVLLILGFLFLVKGASFLVDGASSLAKRLKISELVIGLTVVAFGTSSPELVVNIFAAIQGNTDIAIGNILGSNTFNNLFILGISAVVFPLTVTNNTVWKEIPFSFLAAILVFILGNDQLIDKNSFSLLSRVDGLIFLSFFIVFMYYILGTLKRNDIEIEAERVVTKKFGLAKSLFWIIIGLIGLCIGGKLVVDGAVFVVHKLGVSEKLIGLTIVAMGTSLPELATSVVAASKRNANIAVGNIVGSNIFNIFFILGLSSIINPLPFSANTNIDAGITILASFILFISMFTGKKYLIDRWEGISCILFYVVYVIFLINRG